MRRSFMAMLGLAPVAAVSPPAAAETANYIPYVTLGSQSPIAEDVSNLEWAKRRVAALEWAKRNNLSSGDFPVGLSATNIIDAELGMMKSWSPAYRQRVSLQRHAARYNENHMAEALARVEREVKLALAPEWVRRFLA